MAHNSAYTIFFRICSQAAVPITNGYVFGTLSRHVRNTGRTPTVSLRRRPPDIRRQLSGSNLYSTRDIGRIKNPPPEQPA
jgi:hypothetical protein